MAKDKEIKVKSSTQVYQGNVKITLLNGKKPYKVINKHNYGTAEFFEYIWRRVRGDNLNTKIPSYIFACNENHERLTNYGVITEGQPELTTNNSSTDLHDSSTLKYTFLIPGTIVQNKEIKSFQLCSLDLSSIYAILDLENGITIDNAKTNILIEWSLVLSNGDVI